MAKALLIAEKPSLRRAIEEVYDAHRSEIPYDCTFLDQRGHLLTLKYPGEIDEDFKEWSFDTLPFHPEDHGGFQYKVIEEKKVGSYMTAKERFSAIKEELKTGGYDFVINAGDPDQEGELLVRIVLAAAKCKLPIKRYWSNATTESKILEALKNLRDDDHDPMLTNLLAAAYGRQHSDYRFGMNISRAATLKMGATVACGRVKTPILAIVCRREIEIKDFVPSTCYGVVANYSEGFSGQLFEDKGAPAGEADGEKEDDAQKGLVWFNKEEEALGFIKGLSSPAIVEKFEAKRAESYAPKLFKLATAQIAAGKLGYDASETLSIIQGLYEKGYMSYPRTDCEYLSSTEDLEAMLRSAEAVPGLGAFISKVGPGDVKRVKGTKKWVDDKKLAESGHSALVPTDKKPDFGALSAGEQAIYSMVCKQFVAMFMPPLVQEKTELITSAGGHLFRSTGKTLVDAGYAEVFGTKFSDVEISEHKKGDEMNVTDFALTSKTTTCPKRFTNADLIAVCEAPHKYLDDKRLKSLGKRLSIGTPATRSSIIDELIDRNHYLKRVAEKKAKYIVPTDAGMTIYENLKDLDICKVDLTGEWEEKLEMVRTGAMTLAELEAGMKKDVEALIKDIKDNTDMTKLASRERKKICKCPKCGGDIISGPKSFYCSNYKEKGCTQGAFKMVCDTVLKDEEFAKLIAGETVVVKIRKGKDSWDQALTYDADAERKIAFAKMPEKGSAYKCPACGKDLVDDGRRIFCKDGSCGFAFWKKTAGKVLTEKQIDKFFKEGSTGLVKGLKSKAGKSFDAMIVLDDERKGSKFEFPPREGKKK